MSAAAAARPQVGTCPGCLLPNVPLGPKPGSNCLICERAMLIADEYALAVIRSAVEEWLSGSYIHPDDLISFVRQHVGGGGDALADRWSKLKARIDEVNAGLEAHFEGVASCPSTFFTAEQQRVG